MDLHEDVHRAIEDYLEPNEFRRWLNSALQNSRGVSFLVQKRKATWPDYDDWYLPWQGEARANAVLRWGVDSRNRVVKEEDLNTLSQARITLFGERLQEADDAFVVPPQMSVQAIIDTFVQVAKERPARRRGTIRVQRRWIDDKLPDYEIVAALRELYRGVAGLMTRVHQAGGVDECDVPGFRRDCVTAEIDPHLACLRPGNPLPDGLYDLATGDVMSYEYVAIDRSDAPDDLETVGLKRYGERPQVFRDPLENAVARLTLSKQFLEADGFSGAVLLLTKGDEGRIIPIPIENDRPRELKVAAVIESMGAWPYDGAVYSSEMWLSVVGGEPGESLVGVPRARLFPSNTESYDEDPIGSRDEALIVIGLSADGRSRCLSLPFGRVLGGYRYGELDDDESGENIPAFLRPIWAKWPEAKW
jgi:hypothetical protein